ncbi:hypothetical protein Pcinc_020408 [Petrolisthes cinctipes]|uniref:THAP-type domain-containing protein n=1 Tax=Petrolisthes cinctipes TaxID=88211 RepID=A0AAE1KGG2_PETCI|nr:hypothetical protein Pcinc_020408 [Petrolisthes cinctipes]
MVRCAAYGCKNGDWNIKRNSGITFHRFPNKEKHETRYNKWLRNMRWEKWTPGRRSVICSYHFSAECFDRTGKTVRLRSSAVPTIFDFPSRLCKKLKKRKPPMRRAALSTPTESLDPEPLTREASASPDPSLSTTAVPGPTSPILSPATTSPSLSTTTTPAPTKAHLDVINGRLYRFINVSSGVKEDATGETFVSEALVITTVVNAS